MTVDSCFLATEDTLIVNENDPGAIIFKEKDEACHNTLEVEYFRSYEELDKYMAGVYQKKGGKNLFFYNIQLLLTKEDLLTLSETLLSNTFSSIFAEHIVYQVRLYACINDCLELIEDGYSIYYISA